MGMDGLSDNLVSSKPRSMIVVVVVVVVVVGAHVWIISQPGKYLCTNHIHMYNLFMHASPGALSFGMRRQAYSALACFAAVPDRVGMLCSSAAWFSLFTAYVQGCPRAVAL